eukprot:481110-Rhodomonas_salina.1
MTRAWVIQLVVTAEHRVPTAQHSCQWVFRPVHTTVFTLCARRAGGRLNSVTILGTDRFVADQRFDVSYQ